MRARDVDKFVVGETYFVRAYGEYRPVTLVSVKTAPSLWRQGEIEVDEITVNANGTIRRESVYALRTAGEVIRATKYRATMARRRADRALAQAAKYDAQVAEYEALRTKRGDA